MYERALLFFENYMKNFDLNANKEQINSYYYKYCHTYDVINQMEKITENLPLEEKEKALTVAVFHDLGRFIQLEKCKRYNDVKTDYDHAKESVHILKEEKWFSKNEIRKEVEEELCFAILNHNKKDLPKSIGFKYELAKLLRDADKLAILEKIPLEMKQTEERFVSREIVMAFANKKLVDFNMINSQMDQLLALFAFIFDINYTKSFQLISENGLMDRWFCFFKQELDNETFNMIENNMKEFLKIKQEFH